MYLKLVKYLKKLAKIFILNGLMSCVLLLQFNHIIEAQTIKKEPHKVATAGKDTLFVMLGRSERVEITKKMTDNYQKNIGRKIHEFRAYSIFVRNPQKNTLKLKIENLIPPSKEASIEVEILESSDAEIDFTRGRLAWSLQLKPKEKRKLDIKYNVTYPKGKKIIGTENVLQIQAYNRKAI